MAEAPAAPAGIKFPLGVDNRSREYALADGAARELDNVAVTRDGGLLCRPGLRRVVEGEFHSLFVHPSGRYGLGVKDRQLFRLDRDEALVSLAIPVAGRVSYAVLNGDVYWTDGVSIGQVRADGSVGLWGMPSPPAPQVSAVAEGGLFAGSYQVAMTAVHPSGLESGAVQSVSVTVTEGGGIQVTTPTATGVRFALYRTPAQGAQNELRRTGLFDPGVTVTLGAQALEKSLESLHAVRPLPGQSLVHFKGRLWCASGNVLWFTSERSPHWLFPSQGFYQFEESVTMLGAAEDGIYVGLPSRVYFLQGSDPMQMTQRPVSFVGAVTGTGVEIPYTLFLGEQSFPSRQCAFYDTDGFLCIGKPGGIIVRPTQKNFSAGQSASGTTGYCEYEGLRQLIGCLSGTPTPIISSTLDVAMVFSNGVALNG